MGNASGEDGERGVPSSGVTASGVSLGGAGDGVSACPAAAALMPLLLVPSKLLHEVQDLQPLATKDFLARAIGFFLRQLSSRPFTAGAESLDEKFLVRSLTFLRNALSTSAYLPSRTAAPGARVPSVPRLLRLALAPAACHRAAGARATAFIRRV